MSETKQSPDLTPFENDYDVVGEVKGPGGVRAYRAKRKNTGTKGQDEQSDVLISIVPTPEGDEGNALSHLAADTKLLAGVFHRRLIPVIEGRWIGDNAFAVVTQRTTDPTVEQQLATGEAMSTPRVAAILREVNGLLEWAREHNLVHRHVTTDRIFLEPKTDRVRVMFGAAPIIRLKNVDPETEDARSIVRLVIAMLTGSEDPATYNGKTLTEQRPDLPDQLHEATSTLLEDDKPHTAADVSTYLALVGMAGPLAAGETEVERIRHESLGEALAEREKLAEERATFEQDMAREKSNFERVMAEAREAFDKELAREREKFEKEKEELKRAAIAERESVVAKRAELERVTNERRKEIERAAAEDRRQLEALRAELKRAGELELEKKRAAALDEITDDDFTLERPVYATPMYIPPSLPQLEELAFDDDTALMRPSEPVVVPPAEDKKKEREREREKEKAKKETAVPALPAPVGTPVSAGDSRRKYLIIAGVVGAAALVTAGALTIGRQGRQAAAAPHAAAAPAKKAAVETARGSVALPSSVPLPTAAAIAATDSVVRSAADSLARADSVKEAAARRRRRFVRDSIARVEASFSSAREDSIAKARYDSVMVVRNDSAARARNDSAARARDTVTKTKDSVVVKPDTVPRRQ